MKDKREELIQGIVKKHPGGRLSAAKRGDPAELISAVLTGDELTKDERSFIVELLKKTKSKNGAKYENREIELTMARAYSEAKGENYEAFLAESTVSFELPIGTIKRILRDAKTNPIAQQWRDYIIKTETNDS